MNGLLNSITQEIRLSEEECSYAREARLEWIAEKIQDLALVHSRLATEAEQRVSDSPLSWSQMIFTDIFGPDVSILSDLKDRILRIEKNIKNYKKEARDLIS